MIEWKWIKTNASKCAPNTQTHARRRAYCLFTLWRAFNVGLLLIKEETNRSDAEPEKKVKTSQCHEYVVPHVRLYGTLARLHGLPRRHCFSILCMPPVFAMSANKTFFSACCAEICTLTGDRRRSVFIIIHPFFSPAVVVNYSCSFFFSVFCKLYYVPNCFRERTFDENQYARVYVCVWCLHKTPGIL